MSKKMPYIRMYQTHYTNNELTKLWQEMGLTQYQSQVAWIIFHERKVSYSRLSEAMEYYIGRKPKLTTFRATMTNIRKITILKNRIRTIIGFGYEWTQK